MFTLGLNNTDHDGSRIIDQNGYMCLATYAQDNLPPVHKIYPLDVFVGCVGATVLPSIFLKDLSLFVGKSYCLEGIEWMKV